MIEVRRQRRIRRNKIAGSGIAVGIAVVVAYLVLSPGAPATVGVWQGDPYGVIQTASGRIVFKFFENETPLTFAAFKGLIESGYYNGLPWHRVVANFVIQTGQGPAKPNIPREIVPTLHNDRSFLGVALSSDSSGTPIADSGSTQFYILTGDSRHLDGSYCVFGQVLKGMDVADRVVQGELISSITYVRASSVP
jgi:cyclophilin family peptidyl-prolyl cis-trans isomerase